MTIYIGDAEHSITALRVAAHRKLLRLVARSSYTDDLDSDLTVLVDENILAILRCLLPERTCRIARRAPAGRTMALLRFQ